MCLLYIIFFVTWYFCVNVKIEKCEHLMASTNKMFCICTCSKVLGFLKFVFSNQKLYCSTTADDVARYFVAHAVIIKLCYRGSVLSTLSECVKNVLTQPNVKKSFLKDT